MIRPYPSLFLLSVLMLAGGTAEAAHLRPHLQFSARMDGAQEVPAVITSALGVASVTLNPTRDTLCIQAHWTGLSGPATLAHVHAGVAGVSGPPIIDLSASITGDMLRLEYTGPVTSALIAQFVTGGLYINIHTAANPAGEIRGQLWPEADKAMVADLDGAQEVPPTPTPATGLAVYLLNGPQDNLHIAVQLNDLTSPVAMAHLHTGAPGVSGPPVVDLFPYYDANDNTIIADVDPTAFLADLLNGDIYINVHTTNFMGGEVRGQVLTVRGIAFDAVLNSANNIPPTSNISHGLAHFEMTPDMDSIFFDVQLDSLSSPATLAHLHWGGPTANGTVAVEMSGGINGDRITGWADLSGGPDSLIMRLLEGNLYLNVHTVINPSGEVRGQVYRYWREGYSIDMSGAQEVPSVVTTAQGGGIASVDRDQTNAHVMYVTTAADVTMTHLHLGIAGENGSVIHDLTNELLDNGVFAYWTGAEGFTVANSVQFRSDSLYANVHTLAVSSGEVRGQVHRGSSCDDFFTGITLLPSEEFLIYPQPAHDRLTVMTGPLSQRQLQLFNSLGEQISAEQVKLVYLGDRFEMNVSPLPTGMYLLTWQTDNGPATVSFLKE